MSENTRPVTGGDLHKLWRATHESLPRVENVYNEATKTSRDTLAPGSKGTYGRAFPTWQVLQEMTHEMLYRTATSLQASRVTLDGAIKEFAFVDGDNANDLTEAGKNLDKNLKDPNITDPKEVTEVKGEPVKPEKDDE